MHRGQGGSPTHSDELVLSLIDDIYAAALDSARWAGVVGRIVEATGGTTGQLVSPTENVLTHLWAPYGFDPNIMVPYAQYYHAIDEWTIAADAKPVEPCQVVTGENLMEFSVFKSTEYYNDFLKGSGFERFLGFFVENAKGHPKSSFSVYRPPGSEPFGNDAVRLLNAIAPHVRRAVQLHWKVADLEHDHATNTQALEHLTVGVVLLDETARITYMNPVAQSIASANDGLSVLNGELTASVGSETLALSRLLGETMRATTMLLAPRPETMTISRPSRARPYQLTAMPVAIEGAFAVGRRHSAAIVFISEPAADLRVHVRASARHYGLSPAESRLLQELVDGKPLKRAASDFGISVNTAHSQLTSIFSKTGVHRQPDLVRLVLSFPAR
ncbi:MAG TPA: helix-turn-helix transcriptional regulator [Burkholderiales bacterium]|nr:helix-turn-helix transcriptional regulator [Burkholderiales bacterium]